VVGLQTAAGLQDVEEVHQCQPRRSGVEEEHLRTALIPVDLLEAGVPQPERQTEVAPPDRTALQVAAHALTS
jgi:hypothetical protein